MLQIKNIKKSYRTGDLVQTALDDVSLNFRDNEFVSILGKSGSGKSTLLNVIGGLDRYDSGDLIINGISTKKYKDRDWDSYRNHTIGFIFQSYNLIPHQTVLANVELALTIAGVSRKERKKRAKIVLEKVGLADQIHKKPFQMSGGQMQRVAIATKRRSASVTAAVVKSSAGAAEHMLISKVVNLAAALDKLKEAGLWIAGADMDGKSMYETDMKGGFALVIGGEGNGLSPLIKSKCDFLVSIPLKGKIDSLNAAVAAAVIMFEKAHQDKE